MGTNGSYFENRYQTIFEASGMAMCIIDEDTTIVMANGEFERLSGYSKGEIQGKLSWTGFVQKDDLEKMMEYHKQRRMNGSSPPDSYNFGFLNRKGELLDIHVKITLIPRTKMTVASLMDISGLREEQRRRIQAQQLIESIFRDGQDGIYITDIKGNIIRMNQPALEMFGYEPDEVRNVHLNDLYPEPEDGKIFMDTIMKQGFVKDYEITLKKKDGEILHCILTSSVNRDPDGKVSGSHGFIRNITEQKENEKRLMDSEEKYRTMFMNSISGIYRTTPDGRILAANPALIEMLGFDSLEDLTGRDLNESGYLDTKDRESFRKRMEEENAIKGFSTTWCRKDGALIHVKENSRTIRDPSEKILFYDGTVEDVTGEVMAKKEAELRKSYFEGLFNAALEGIILVDRNARVIQVNSEFGNMFGYSGDDIIGGYVDEMIRAPSENEDHKNVTSAVLNGETYSTETTRVGKEGNVIHVSIMASPIRFRNEIIGAFAIYRDITRRKRQEMRILELNEKLKDITKILRHDFTNNLMIIQQASELMKEGKDLNLLEMIQKSVNNSITLIRSMKEYEAVFTEEKQPRHYHIRDMIKDIMLDTNIPFVIRGDNDFHVESEYHSVINNLVVNSIKHGRTEKIEFVLGRDEGVNILEMIDHGVGIPDEIKEKIFEQGYSHGPASGSGLGLFLVRTMIEKHGGKVEVRDNDGGGAIFRISIPEGQAPTS